jgi:ribosome-associated heat shock protein Hsp15
MFRPAPRVHGVQGDSHHVPLFLYHNEGVNGVRIDKWLWAARFFKTRSLASHACELGRVHARGQLVKPAREVHVGDMLRVKNDSGEFEIEVLGLSDLRGPAAVAQTLYRETEESKLARQRAVEERKMLPFFEALPEGKPSKRDRRRYDRLRGR